MRAWQLVLVNLGAIACGGEAPCLETGAACTLEREISTVTLTPGQEIDQLCQSWTLDNPTELWVSNVRMQNGGMYHHSNWFYVPDDKYVMDDGAWPCDQASFSEIDAAIHGGYLFAQSTQIADESQTFPDGVAVRIPPYSRIIGSTHLLNISDEPVSTTMSMRIDTVGRDGVRVKLVPARLQYVDLSIEPMARASFTMDCDLSDTHQRVMGAPLDYKVHYALPHFHGLGRTARLEILGGPRDGEDLYEVMGHGMSWGRAFDPPIDLAGATGLRFTCTFDNPRDVTVGWGIGDQEMCVTAIFAETGMGVQADVVRDSAVTGTAADGTIEHAGPCRILGVPWNHDKPGGPPR
jgi:hypothetical protein